MKCYNVIGVMSGTSLDGVDLVYTTFDFNGETWSFKNHFSKTVAYNQEWVSVLKNLISNSPEELKEIDENYTVYLSKVIKAFIDSNRISGIDAVCSHGHTALHQPDRGITYQIGNLPKLATLINETVVCDFRIQDVLLGGQGAPLVPIGDKILFSEYDYCINLGGFANISRDVHNERIAYDICPVNIVLNHYVKALNLPFDDEGTMAETGTVNHELLDMLNNLDFYKMKYPKSLGLEWVNENVFPLIDMFNIEIKNVLRTFVEHISIQISNEINRTSKATVLITGGGTYNIFLINKIKEKTKHSIIIPNNTLVEFKEAIVFGFLGVLKLREEVNCLSSVTGAKLDHSSGKVYRA